METIIPQKFCSGCKQSKIFNAFSKNKRTSDGLQKWCQECCSANQKKYKLNPLKGEIGRGRKPEPAGPNQTKQCKRCRLWLTFSEFHRNKSNSDGMHRWCKECNNNYRKQNKALYTSEKGRADNWRKKFGITPQQYDAMLTEQGGVCIICKEPEVALDHRSGLTRMLAVDHDHETGDVRALLCAKCNMSLGRMGEDPARIRTLARYAEWCQTRDSFEKFV